MSISEPTPRQDRSNAGEDRTSLYPEPRLLTRGSHDPVAVADSLGQIPPAPRPNRSPATPQPRLQNLLLRLFWAIPVLIVLIALTYFVTEHWMRASVRANLPQIDGSLSLPALQAPVNVLRDAHGVPHIQAATTDDLFIAQGFVTAQDRLFQMDLLRRHAAGDLAEVLGPGQTQHDRLQRTFQIRAAAERALTTLPPTQLHMLQKYAEGVNAGITAQRDHLPIEFRVMHYTPAPWTPRDSVLVELAMYQDLTNTFPTTLARAAFTAKLPADLVDDLYPVGSWRDHPPTTPEPDLTLPGPPIEQVPLDESQAMLHLPSTAEGKVQAEAAALLAPCADCRSGSNEWAVSGAHTASGKPLLANDMHLQLAAPSLWYEADLKSQDGLHVAGLSLPGVPLIVVGHNEHLAWGFTNLGADVQDLYYETLRGTGDQQQFQAIDGSWQPVLHLPERIHIRGGRDQLLDVLATRHGQTITPLLSNILADKSRAISLRWTLYDPTACEIPTEELARAKDWPTFLAGLAHMGGPAVNVVYADDLGHIAYKAVGRIPVRGPARNPALGNALPDDVTNPEPARSTTETPTIAAAPDPLATSPLAVGQPAAPLLLAGRLSPVPAIPTARNEWTGYIPFDKLPEVLDPVGGVLVTANARIVPDDYPYPVALNWAAPYRNERLWHLLANRTGLRPADMLAIQSDIYSDFDHVLAERLAYALDHSATKLPQAADLLRTFNGQMTADSHAAAIVAAVHQVLWSMLINPHLPHAMSLDELDRSYLWGEKDYALEQILMHQPPRWLPSRYANWNDFLAAAVTQGLHDAKAPTDLTKWHYGAIHSVDLEHPLFSQLPWMGRMLALPTGTGPRPQSGDATTVKQVGRSFGPSERFTADLANPDQDTLNLPLGQSGNPASPWYMDQFPAWYHVTTFAFPFTATAIHQAATHTLVLTPK